MTTAIQRYAVSLLFVAVSSMLSSVGMSSPAHGATLQVPAQHPTIQAGINAAVPGDLVAVAPGTYNEAIDFMGKAITVIGTGGAPQTFLEPPTGVDASVVTFQSGETASSVLIGFTIRNGHGSLTGYSMCGGGILCLNSSPTITQNTITGNGPATPMGSLVGGGICCANASPVITENIIANNDATWGAGLYVGPLSNPTVESNQFLDNDAWRGGGISMDSSDATIHRNIFIGNHASFVGGSIGGGGGMYIAGGAPTLTHNTFYDNSADDMGGAVFAQGSAVVVRNCIMWANPALAASDFSSFDVTPNVTYSNIAGGWPGTGNLNTDPLFVDAANRDLNLLPNSPCVDAGDPLDPVDPDLTPPDMGALPTGQFAPQFTRADCNADGSVNLSDAVYTLGYLFVPFPTIPLCAESCDANEDFVINVADPVFTLNYLFQGGSPPSAPFPNCGMVTMSPLGCQVDACP